MRDGQGFLTGRYLCLQLEGVGVSIKVSLFASGKLSSCQNWLLTAYRTLSYPL